MAMWTCLVPVLALVSGSLAAHLTYTDCNTSPNKVAHFDHATLSADPVHIPGPETGSIDVHVLKPISGVGHYSLHLAVSKKALFLNVPIPCLNQVGSCTYDLCTLLSGEMFNNEHHCPLEIAQSTPDFNCACPFSPGNYHLNPTTFQIPKLAGLWSWLAAGDYHVHATLADNTNNGEQVACYDIHISTETDCSGIACLIGKK